MAAHDDSTFTCGKEATPKTRRARRRGFSRASSAEVPAGERTNRWGPWLPGRGMSALTCPTHQNQPSQRSGCEQSGSLVPVLDFGILSASFNAFARWLQVPLSQSWIAQQHDNDLSPGPMQIQRRRKQPAEWAQRRVAWRTNKTNNSSGQMNH